MSKTQQQKEVFVYAHWEEFCEPTLMGMLRGTPIRGKEIFSFEYDKAWLDSNFAQVLDPDLGFYSGPQYINDENRNNFGLFLDSSPDRWGRLLMRRREAALAERSPRTLFETDYLLGVYDGHRMGGLRFKTDPEGPFLNNNKRMTTPPWTSLRELEQASLKLEEDDAPNDPEYIKWLNLLFTPGTSLGGARPKASVQDKERVLWIAKFPSKNDDGDVGAWEMVINHLAKLAGLRVAEGKIRKFSSSYNTYLTRRFDRTKSGKRLHFASAMTMLGYTDGQGHEDDASYIEIAEFLSRNGAQVNKDLEELWRRIVFYVCVSNTDDHLRNHGFMLTDKGWVLSPAYDINPVATGSGLKLNISEDDNSLDLDLVMSVIEYFRIKKDNADKIIEQVTEVVRGWGDIATKYGIPQRDKDRMAPAFKLAM